jgi:sterol 14-demethylase
LQGKEVRAALDKTFAGLYHDLDGGFKPINFVFPNLPLPSYWKRDKAHVKMRHFYLNILERRRANGGPGEDDVDMLASLTGQSYKDGTPITDTQVAHMMIALLMAGQHTSAGTTSWALLHLGKEQQLQCVARSPAMMI